MSSRRDLKKDIDYLIFEVISDCFTYSSVNPNKQDEKVSEIISDAITLRNDLVARVNHPDGKDNPKILKSFYKAVEKDLMQGVNSLFGRLSALSAKQK